MQQVNHLVGSGTDGLFLSAGILQVFPDGHVPKQRCFLHSKSSATLMPSSLSHFS